MSDEDLRRATAVVVEWSSGDLSPTRQRDLIAAALTDARADELRDAIAEIAYEFEGHIPDMTNVNLGAIMARLGARADRLEAP